MARITDGHEKLQLASEELVVPSNLNFLAPSIIDDLVRVGADRDGGYAVPKSSVNAAEVLVSMGINEDWSFEEHFKRLKPAAMVHAYDHTVSRSVLVGRLQRALIKVCLGKASISEWRRRSRLVKSYKSFFQSPVRHFEQRIHNRLDQKYDVTLDTVFERADSDKIFLKIDIEGSEYRIIDDIVRYSSKIVAMVVEFHDTEPLRTVFDASIRRLLERFEIVHLHANNFVGVARDGVPDVLEISFVNRARFAGDAKRVSLPVPLIDYPNDPGKPDYRLRFEL